MQFTGSGNRASEGLAVVEEEASQGRRAKKKTTESTSTKSKKKHGGVKKRTSARRERESEDRVFEGGTRASAFSFIIREKTERCERERRASK